MSGLLTGLAGPLALVVGLVFLAAAAWRRVRGGIGHGARQALPMELVQRLAIGPKQGLALVRIEGRLYAVGSGEGLSITPIGPTGLRADAVASSAFVPLDAFGPADGRPGPAVRPSVERPTVTVPATRSAAAWPAATSGTTAGSRRTSAAPRAATALDTNGDVRLSVAPAIRRDLQDVLRTALRTATTLGALLALALSPASAQRPSGPTPQVVPPPRAPVGPVAPGARPAPAAAPAGAAVAPVAPGAPAGPTTTSTTLPPTKAPAPLSAMQTTEQVIQRLAPQMDLSVGGTPGKSDGLRMSGTVGVVVMMGLLTLLPTLLLLMTGFARILIVLGFVRQAIGAQSAPPTQLLAALALLLTGFVMAPTLDEANRTALQPWLAGQMEQAEMMEAAVKPFRTFMLRQTRDKDIETFLELSRSPVPATPEEIPLVVLASAFTTSELRTAFQMGFAIFLPFIVVDMVVSSVLMSMGMYMLPPAMIALPFKLLLFVLVDGWTLVVQSLVQSFR
jgi:flagellar biosynthetic protein FliP